MTTPGGGRGDLYAAARDAVASEAQKKAEQAAADEAAASAPKRPWLVPTLGAGCLLMAALLVIRPSFLGGGSVPADPPSIQSANQRGVLAVVAVRLRAYAKKHGSLPGTLAELGAGVPTGLEYQRVDATRFVLKTTTKPLLTFTSEDDPSSLLKDQFTTLRRRKP